MRHRPGKKLKYGDLDLARGMGLLKLFEDFCRTIHADQLVDNAKQHYVAIEKVEREGRGVFVTLESGNFGNPGKTFHVRSHKAVHTRSDLESATVHTRFALIVPPGATTALFLFEREGLYGGGPRVYEMFKDALLASFSDDFFPTDAVIETDAWRKDADLRRVVVTAKAWKPSVGGTLSPSDVPLGTLRQEFRPPMRTRFFPRAFRDKLLNKTLDMSLYMSFASSVNSETRVQLEKDNRRKTFLIGRDKSPTVQLELTDEGKPRLGYGAIKQRMFEEAQDYYEADGLTWNTSWQTGTVKWGNQNGTWAHQYVDAP